LYIILKFLKKEIPKKKLKKFLNFFKKLSIHKYFFINTRWKNENLIMFYIYTQKLYLKLCYYLFNKNLIFYFQKLKNKKKVLYDKFICTRTMNIKIYLWILPNISIFDIYWKIIYYFYKNYLFRFIIDFEPYNLKIKFYIYPEYFIINSYQVYFWKCFRINCNFKNVQTYLKKKNYFF